MDRYLEFVECCFCEKLLEKKYSNNPSPLEDSQKDCCNYCNKHLVIPYRNQLLKNRKRNKDNLIFKISNKIC